MKNKFIKGIILIGLGFACMSASVITSLTTMKPATPTSVVVITGDSGTMKNQIIKYVQKGYIVKTLTGTGNGAMYDGICVMEKY